MSFRAKRGFKRLVVQPPVRPQPTGTPRARAYLLRRCRFSAFSQHPARTRAATGTEGVTVAANRAAASKNPSHPQTRQPNNNPQPPPTFLVAALFRPSAITDPQTGTGPQRKG